MLWVQDPWESTLQASPGSERRFGEVWHGAAVQAINRRRASGQRKGPLLGEIPPPPPQCAHGCRVLPSKTPLRRRARQPAAPGLCTNILPRLPHLCSTQSAEIGQGVGDTEGPREKAAGDFGCAVGVLERELVETAGAE